MKRRRCWRSKFALPDRTPLLLPLRIADLISHKLMVWKGNGAKDTSVQDCGRNRRSEFP